MDEGSDSAPGTRRAGRGSLMRLLVRRIGFRNRRRLTVGLLAVSAAAVVLWLLPWRAGPASLELVALGSDGRFQSEVQIPRTWTDTSVSSQGALARVPLVLGVVNSGGRPARPGRNDTRSDR